VAKAAGWFVLISAVLATLFLFVVPSGGEASLAGESTLGIAAVMAVRKPVRQSGGWRKALGWSLPGWRDAKWIAIWIGWQLLARYATTLVMLVLVPALRHQVVTNTGPIQHAGGVSLALLVATAVLVAPPVEELLFRGLLLRAAMRRFRFVPAALFSSVVFGLGHAPEAGTLAGAGLLAVLMTVFGVLQCLLVRRVGRLAPGMAVHAALNGLAVALVLR
jgi:membrane protease YdiL (CAAX protease family)